MAVVGAGIAGLACAELLRRRGWQVRLFDKGRGPGGRMSTRRARGWRFDHGAQYFTVRDARFARAVEAWRRAGVVARWDGEIVVLEDGSRRPTGGGTERWVGVPGMSAVCRHLGAGLEVAFGTRVERLERAGESWRLTSAAGEQLGRYDAVVVAVPAPQAAHLLAPVAPGVAARCARVDMAPCWAAMVAFDRPLELGFDGAFVHRSALSWVARNGSKPGRPPGEAWVLHGSPDWSRDHLELAPEAAAERLLAALAAACGGIERRPVFLDAHRWRYALPAEPLPETCLLDAGLRLAVCGDWCAGPRVEGAYLSGRAAAERLAVPRP